MEIDNCGCHSEKLTQIFNNIMDMKRRNGEKATIYSINKLDMDLYNAYQKILYVAQNTTDGGNVISKSLSAFQKAVESGSIDTVHISEIAEEIAINTVMNEERGISNDIAIAEGIAGAAVLGIVEQNIINSMCTEKMENMHKVTYQDAVNGDEKAIAVLDLINKGAKYIAISDKLNPKGKEAGALALIIQLTQTGNQEAIEMAKNIADQFGLEDILQEDRIDLEKANSRFSEIRPNHNIQETSKRISQNAIDNKERVISSSSESFRESVTEDFIEKKINEFRRTLTKAIEEGDNEKVTSLINGNPDLAKQTLEADSDIYERFGRGKKGGKIIEQRMEKISRVLDLEKEDEYER